MTKINIAIDGYAGCGKSTLAKELASALNYTFIDTGALYRGITLFLSRRIQGEITNEVAAENLHENPKLEFSSNGNHLLLNSEDVESIIRSTEIASKVSMVAALSSVRNYLLDIQRDFIAQKGIVMEGRDIGTVIMPEAEAKFFITASMAVRVERRFLQLQESGKPESKAAVEENLTSRDFKDATREEAPLKLASDAIVVDTSNLSRQEQLKCLVALVTSKVSSDLLPFIS